MTTLPIVDQQQPNHGEEKKAWYQDEETKKKLEVVTYIFEIEVDSICAPEGISDQTYGNIRIDVHESFGRPLPLIHQGFVWFQRYYW